MRKLRKAAEVFHDVEPHLKVVPGGSRRSHQSPAPGLNGPAEAQWEAAAGRPCPDCGRETLRFLPGRNGQMVCPACARRFSGETAEQQEGRAMVRELRHQVRSRGRVDPGLLRSAKREGGGS